MGENKTSLKPPHFLGVKIRIWIRKADEVNVMNPKNLHGTRSDPGG